MDVKFSLKLKTQHNYKNITKKWLLKVKSKQH